MQTFLDRSAETTLVLWMGVEGKENAFTMLEASRRQGTVTSGEGAQETGRKEDLGDNNVGTLLTPQEKQCRDSRRGPLC